jgi:uncharacterized membrane protein
MRTDAKHLYQGLAPGIVSKLHEAPGRVDANIATLALELANQIASAAIGTAKGHAVGNIDSAQIAAFGLEQLGENNAGSGVGQASQGDSSEALAAK